MFVKLFLHDLQLSTTCKLTFPNYENALTNVKNLTLKKCVFFIFYEIILGFIMFGVGKFLGLKEIEAIFKLSKSMSFPQGMEIFNGLAQFYKWFVKKKCVYYGPHYEIDEEINFFSWISKCQEVGYHKKEICKMTHYNCPNSIRKKNFMCTQMNFILK